MTNRRPGDGSKVAGSGHLILKNEVHHWWPSKLSELWQNAEGGTHRIAWDGQVVSAPSKRFGSIKNAHKIEVEGPWNGTIEPIFDYVDTNFPKLVGEIEGACNRARGWLIPKKVSLSVAEQQLLDEAVASLVLRSPGQRNRIQLRTNQARAAFGLSPIGDRDNLIAGNIHNYYNSTTTTLYGGSTIFFILLKD